MRYDVRLRAAAERDLAHLYDFIGAHNQDAAIALVRQLRQACYSLREMPHRGRPRDDLGPGLRILSVERRAVIAYRVGESLVEVVNVFYGGQDYEFLLRDSGDRS